MNSTDAPAELDRAGIDGLRGLTLIEFGTSWCGYCRAAQPLIAAALTPHPQLRHLKIEDGPGRPAGRSFRVKLWPTLILIGDGAELGRCVRPVDSASISKMLTIGMRSNATA